MKERIREIRKDKGYTIKEFADLLEISKSSIESYENGRRVPNNAFITLFCKRFNINKLWLQSGEGEKYARSTDERIDYVENLLTESDEFHDMILAIMKTYASLDDKSKEVVKEFIEKFRSNLKKG